MIRKRDILALFLMNTPAKTSESAVQEKKKLSISPSKDIGGKIRISELRYRRLFETAQDGILILDANTGRIADANPFLKDLLGYSLSELVGKELWEIGVFKDIIKSKAAFQQLQKEGYIRYKDFPLQTKKGRSIDVEFISNIYMVDTQRVVQCNIRDITDRKKIEKLANSRADKLEQLTKSQEETKKAMLNVMEDLEAAKSIIEIERAKDEAMLASIGDGLIAVDNERKIMVINKTAEKLLGWRGKELIGKELSSLPLEDEAGNVIPYNKRPTHIALSTGKTTENTYFFVRKDKTRFPIAINVTPIRYGKAIIGAVDIFRDITREREIDRAKSEFVSLASHQLRTPLGIAKWYIEALQGEGYLDNVPQIAKEYINEIYKSNERLLSLVRDLLSISRIDQGKIRNNPQKVNIAALIKQKVSEMTILAKENDTSIQVKIKKSDIPDLFIDSLRLEETIENLITNAIVYGGNSKQIEVIVNQKGDDALIAVKDAGMGISKEDKKRIFTKFFRSQQAAIKNTEGSGLGLYVVKSYVKGWGGSIKVKSTQGKGSTFTILLPITTHQHEPKARDVEGKLLGHAH